MERVLKILTFHEQPVRHVRHLPDGHVLLNFFERGPDGHHRYSRVTEAQWRAGRGIYLTSRRRSRGDNARRFEQAGVRLPKPR
jgi:hypothetical protein